MRTLISAATLALVLTACGGGDDNGGDSFKASGKVTIIGADKAQVLSADGAGEGERCQGTGLLSDFGGGDEVVVLDADGKKIGVGRLQEGKLPEAASELLQIGLNSCVLGFTVDDIPSGDGLMTLRIGEKETTFKMAEASNIEVTVAGDSYP